MFFQSPSNVALEKALNGTWQRYQLVSHNIANEDTPGFKAKRVDFETALSSEIRNLRNAKDNDRQAASERIGKLQPRVYEDTSTIGRADGNNVDINAEQIELTRVILQYQALSQRVGGYYSNIKYAISGGR